MLALLGYGSLLATTPDDTIFTNGDFDNCAEIMHSANALRKTMTQVKLNQKSTKVGNGSTY